MSKKKSIPSNARRMPKKLKDTEEQPRPKKSAKSKPVFPAVIKDLRERERMGIKKYGQALHTHNGRSALADAYQESLDQTLYLKQRLMEEDGIVVIDIETKREDLSDYMPKLDPYPTPELRPLEHFPAPIVPPSPVEESRVSAREFLGKQRVDCATLDISDFYAKPGRFIPVQGDPSQVRKPWFMFDFLAPLRPFFFPPKKESVLEEAQRLVHGDRGANYGHPFDDFGRTAGMVTALLGNRLNGPLTQEDVAKIMICVKLSRETNAPKRDNRVDMAGYVETLDMVVEERKRREVR